MRIRRNRLIRGAQRRLRALGAIPLRQVPSLLERRYALLAAPMLYLSAEFVPGQAVVGRDVGCGDIQLFERVAGEAIGLELLDLARYVRPRGIEIVMHLVSNFVREDRPEHRSEI